MRILGGVNLPVPHLSASSASFVRGVGKMGLVITGIALVETARTAAWWWGKGGTTDLLYRTIQQCTSEANAHYPRGTPEWNTDYRGCFDRLMP